MQVEQQPQPKPMLIQNWMQIQLLNIKEKPVWHGEYSLQPSPRDNLNKNFKIALRIGKTSKFGLIL